MKTSNKLLLSLLAVVIISIFAVNVILKSRLDKKTEPKVSVEVSSTENVITSDSDSIAMEKAMENE
jgi:hypothetical protein